MKTANHNTIYCAHCATWSTRTKEFSDKMVNRCKGISRTNRSTLRLLQAGIQPAKGAKLPEHLKIKHRKKSSPCISVENKEAQKYRSENLLPLVSSNVIERIRKRIADKANKSPSETNG